MAAPADAPTPVARWLEPGRSITPLPLAAEPEESEAAPTAVLDAVSAPPAEKPANEGVGNECQGSSCEEILPDPVCSGPAAASNPHCNQP